MILNPAKTRDVKYSLKPVTAIVCKVALFSLLKADAIGSANTNKDQIDGSRQNKHGSHSIPEKLHDPFLLQLAVASLTRG